MPNHQSNSSRSGKNRAAKVVPSQSKLPVASFPTSSFEVNGHAFMELPLHQRVAKISKSFKLPVLNQVNTSRVPAVCKDVGVRSPMLTCRNEWRLPTYNETVQSDSNSQPSFIRSVSASESESWSDDLENEMTGQLQASLTRLEDLFYSSYPVTSNKELCQEIKLWQSRFPFLRIIGKKAKIISNPNVLGSETKLEKEEIIIKHGDYIENDLNHWMKVTAESTKNKDDAALRKQIKNLVISQLTNHFIVLLKDQISEDRKPITGRESRSKTYNKNSNKSVDKTERYRVDINDNRLKPKEDLNDILNISPISLKMIVPKSSRFTNLSKRDICNLKSRTSATETASSHYERKISTKITNTVSITPRSAAEDQLFLPSKSFLFTRKPFELYSKKLTKRSSRNDKLSVTNTSRCGTLPPLRNPGLRPTSAVYNSHNKLANDARPTSSLILAPSLLKDEFAKTNGS